jgi:hypothetical protein
VDIPFPRAVRDALLAKGLADEHHWVPDSGWVTFRIRREDQMAHAIWLMRVSYARYAIKNSQDSRKMFEDESARLGLQEPFLSLLGKFVRDSGESRSEASAERKRQVSLKEDIIEGASR